jgi:hypothetical protein
MPSWIEIALLLLFGVVQIGVIVLVVWLVLRWKRD